MNNFFKNKYIQIILGIIIIISIYFFTNYILKTFVYPFKHFDIVKQEAEKNNVDPYLILAIIKTESGFDIKATSNKDAKGLMQIIDSTADDMNELLNSQDTSKIDLYDENTNISLGCKYVSYLIKKYNGNYYLAICAYNAGMGNVDKWIDKKIISNNLDTTVNTNIPFNETSKYLNKVVSAYKMYRYLYK